MSTKQVIVMRTDLNMRKGKMVAQGCHSSLKVFFDRIENINTYPDGNRHEVIIDPITSEMREWIEGTFTKICVKCDSKEELYEIYNQATVKGLPCSLIIDNGLTEFNGVPTATCIAIGPASAEKIDKITGHLKLL